MLSPAITTLLIVLLLQSAPEAGQDVPSLEAAVQRFFATQETEDVAAYQAQWSKTAKRPTAEQIKFVFDSGDDKYSEIAIQSTRTLNERTRVLVSVVRDRTTPSRVPGGPPRTFRSTLVWSLVFVRENSDWKLAFEGPAIDGLAEDLLEADASKRAELLEADKDLVGLELISALARRAGQAAQMSDYGRSQRAFELMRDVSRLIGDRKAEGEALQNIANALYFQRNMTAALSMYEQRLVLEREREDPVAISQSLLGIATVRYTFAEYTTALAAYREALALQEKGTDESVIATTLISTGNIQYLQGEYTAAIADFTRSRDISKRATNIGGEADAVEGMGRVLLAQGDYLAALDAFTDVLAEAKSRDHRNDQGMALLSIGDVHFRLGNVDSARLALDEARGHFEATKDLVNAGRAWQAVALTDLAASRFTLSEEEYRKSAAMCASAANKECEASAIVGLAFAQAQQEKYKEGIASYTTAIEAFVQLTRPEQAARARIGLSQALLGSGAFEAAVAAAERARTDAVAIGSDDVLWRALVAQANGLRRLRERPAAIEAATAAVAAVDRLLAVARIRPSAPVARDSASAFAMLALLQAENGDASAAFDTVERMRAHDLRVTLAAGERDISRGMTDAEREDERIVSVDLVALHAQLTREQTLPKPDAQRLASLQKRIAEATEKRTAQQARLFERLPALKVWRGLAPAATVADVVRVLPDDKTVLVELVVGEDTMLTLVARRREGAASVTAHFEPSNRRTIATRVAALLSPESMKDQKRWNLAAAELIPGLSAVFAGAARAIVIPHEVLWRVPFEALPTDSGYVVDTCSIVYASSLTALVNGDAPALAANPISRIQDSIVAIAAPALPPATVDAIARTAPGWALRPDADGTEEMKIIGAVADSARVLVISGEDATEALVRERLRFGDLIDIAAPFRINGASPLFSPLLVVPDPGNDGTLEPREIMNLSLEARLAILSDGGAMSMRDAADEVAAVAWAWRAAGVPSVMMPRWQIEPAVSKTFLTALHERLRAHDTPEAALKAARARVRESGALPSSWAAWLLVGVPAN
jgi:tetratricopeptide (TPR) repeat protein